MFNWLLNINTLPLKTVIVKLLYTQNKFEQINVQRMNVAF